MQRLRFLAIFFLVATLMLSACKTEKGGNNHEESLDKYTHDVGYIDPSTARLNNGFEVCDEDRIYQYYNPQEASYSKGKNGIRKFIQENYINEGYTDSGYLTIRFVINCKGKTGRFVIHENDLDLNPTKLDSKLVEHIFNITSQLKDWNPNIIHGSPADSYMFLTYRIENGEIVEILP